VLVLHNYKPAIEKVNTKRLFVGTLYNLYSIIIIKKKQKMIEEIMTLNENAQKITGGV